MNLMQTITEILCEDTGNKLFSLHDNLKNHIVRQNSLNGIYKPVNVKDYHKKLELLWDGLAKHPRLSEVQGYHNKARKHLNRLYDDTALYSKKSTEADNALVAMHRALSKLYPSHPSATS
jgi:hypothetical protein